MKNSLFSPLSTKLLITGILVFSCYTMFGQYYSQQRSRYNHFSVGLTTGMEIPLKLSPNSNMETSKFLALKQFQFSVRYMYDTRFGAKLHYGFNRFQTIDDSDLGITMNRIGLEGVVNVGRLIVGRRGYLNNFTGLFHAGVGITFSKSSSGTPGTTEGIDHIGNIIVGLTGEYKINSKFSILADITYFANLKQHEQFNGLRYSLHPSEKSFTGAFMNISIGVMYKIGKRTLHADYY